MEIELFLVFASIVSLISVSEAGKCDVLSLQVNGTDLLEYDGIEVLGSTTHASCGSSCAQPNGKIQLQLSDIDPVVNKMILRIPNMKEMWLAERFSMVGDHKLYWPEEVKISVSPSGTMENEINLKRQYKSSASAVQQEDKKEGFFTFEMKSSKKVT